MRWFYGEDAEDGQAFNVSAADRNFPCCHVYVSPVRASLGGAPSQKKGTRTVSGLNRPGRDHTSHMDLLVNNGWTHKEPRADEKKCS